MLTERIRRRLDEFLCDHCREPVYVGSDSVVVETSGGRYCSMRCAGHDWEHTERLLAMAERLRGLPSLFQPDQPSLF